MPTYEYECKDCGYRFLQMQNIKDDPLSVCSQCDGELRRIVSGGTRTIFKGKGFYCTDNRRIRHGKR